MSRLKFTAKFTASDQYFVDKVLDKIGCDDLYAEIVGKTPAGEGYDEYEVSIHEYGIMVYYPSYDYYTPPEYDLDDFDTDDTLTDRFNEIITEFGYNDDDIVLESLIEGELEELD
jgi:hypothetical protein